MLLQRIRKQNGTLALLMLVVLLGYNLTGTLLGAAENPPGITTQFDPITWIDHSRDQELIDFLLENGETRGYTSYWVQTPIVFLSDERIISGFSPFLGRALGGLFRLLHVRETPIPLNFGDLFTAYAIKSTH